MHLASLRLPAFFLSAFALAAAAHATVTEKFSQTHPLAADGVVALDSVNGSVEIVGWDKNEVSIEAEKIASDADGLKRIEIVVDASPTRVAIKTKLEKKWFSLSFRRAEVRYKLHVPVRAALKKIDVVNADVTVRGVQGYVDLDSVNGSIDAEGLASGGRFDTVNGSIRAAFAKLSSGDRIVLDTVNGSCTAIVPAAAAFTLKADSVNGSISCDFPITIGKSGRHHLTGSVNGGGAEIVLDSVNGGLTVRGAN
ncbi:DUF4097 family beta strand repeat-containing protein [Oleiharenicola sp. Vm1]|uniref:DUF4097 family beta strand repeat-containing protein n=1 Tax=Oleiharenicola sp. Vm1 TaxID=3398393 RepID=UPI0039F56454